MRAASLSLSTEPGPCTAGRPGAAPGVLRGNGSPGVCYGAERAGASGRGAAGSSRARPCAQRELGPGGSEGRALANLHG